MKIEQPACEQCKSRKNSLFHFCHLQEIRDIDQAKTFTLYKKGQFIFHEGANPVGLYCINSGRVKIFRHAPDGKEQITRLARAGDFVGYCSLLSNHPYPVSAAALEEAMICLVPKTKIIELIRNNFSFSDGLLKLLSRTVEYSFEKMTDLAYKPVRGRLAEALLFLHNFYRDEQNPSGLIALTREDLAAFTGTVKETAIRMLNEFKQENLIEIHRNGISVKNMSGLIRISNLYD
ncbi:MAG: Crp/Fnr family transcriptional regulator [Chitinophagales bacterium]|nr:MAG: Crp/Fnr family transcriptional regulator [Chitinophagales bacterium]